MHNIPHMKDRQKITFLYSISRYLDLRGTKRKHRIKMIHHPVDSVSNNDLEIKIAHPTSLNITFTTHFQI